MLQETTGESEGGGSGQSAGCFPDIYDGHDFKNWLAGTYIGKLCASTMFPILCWYISVCTGLTDAHCLLLICVYAPVNLFACCVCLPLSMCLTEAHSLFVYAKRFCATWCAQPAWHTS